MRLKKCKAIYIILSDQGIDYITLTFEKIYSKIKLGCFYDRYPKVWEGNSTPKHKRLNHMN